MPSRGHEPVRTCVGCRREGLKPELVRLVASAEGVVVVDRTGHAPGRGVYLHRDATCIESARKRRQLERSLGAATPPALWLEIPSV